MNDSKVTPVEAQAVPDLPVAWMYTRAEDGRKVLDFAPNPNSAGTWKPLFTRPTPAAADLTYWKACESQNLDLLAAIGYPHERDTMVSPEEYAAELKRKADAFHLAGDETGRTSVEGGVNAPSAEGSAPLGLVERLRNGGQTDLADMADELVAVVNRYVNLDKLNGTVGNDLHHQALAAISKATGEWPTAGTPNECPKCGLEEWDYVYEPGRVSPSYKHCSRCDTQWSAE